MDLPALRSDGTELALSPRFFESLKTPQDYEAVFQQVTENKNKLIWWEADIILSYYQKFLGKHLDIYRAGQLLNDSTIKYYLRTASAFPAETRIPNISFNHHYQASFADEWDSKTLRFNGEKRFHYSEEAADNGWSTRKLKFEMELEKEKATKVEEELLCAFCTQPKNVTYFTLFEKGKNDPIMKLTAHKDCIQQLFPGHFYL